MSILFLRFIFCVCVHVRAWPETSDVLELELQRLKATQLLSTLLQPLVIAHAGGIASL